ncbi:putative metal-dependent HD superfamily phosphohydrolase [Antricoccus suffuscus]|uniref:Putative metal-dependent HD superfamily phosphohydrolase n=1 Tax=Antricoccus suffuscus TaxID=1629062 RepID=A0A2T0ZKH1_9ACTN|nr:metal-dependent phosphohydrolase [Antricoccus suffuscus]PRZ36638.1 putative metal-dependent HD superfamily phosphohydrolase [Antricoccus suffuscus]
MSKESTLLWDSWVTECGGSETSRVVWTDLINRWGEPHRGYHNLQHLLHVLIVIDELAHEGEDLHAARLAAWFHDAVYDPTATDNEARSAELAGTALASLHTDPALVDEVRALIVMTETHETGAEASRASLLMHDADLAILGVPAAQYLRYVNGVRTEYAHIPDDEFKAARSHILQGFLERDRLYLLPEARAAYEDNARTNIAAELQVYHRDDPEAGPSLFGIPLS